MNNAILIVFGLPGVGKSYVAKILADSFGYFPYDGDDALPKDMKQALFRKESITDQMRKNFIANMIESTQQLAKKQNKLVVHQTFLKEFMRRQVIDALPQAKLILVKSNNATREQRYMKRTYFNLGLEYLRHMSSLFEPVRTVHDTLYNNKEGNREITMQLKQILKVK